MDASIAVCLATGDVSDELQHLAVQWAKNGERFIAPNLIGFEVTNALYKAARKGADMNAIALAFETFRRMNIEPVDCSDFHEEVLATSVKYGMRASYDTYYLVLAAKRGIDLYTCDRTFFNSLRGEWPQVHSVAQPNSTQ